MATIVTILLFLPLTLGSENDLQVIQEPWKALSHSGTVTITCMCNQKEPHNWMLNMRLRKANKSEWLCSVNHRESSPSCSAQEVSWCHTTFTLSNVLLDTGEVYVCEFKRVKPTPILTYLGNGTRLFPEPDCPMFNLLTWVLSGVASFFCLCSLCLAFAYIKLKTLQSDDPDESVTYVQMQRKKRDIDSNGEYVDMREVHSMGRGSGRDVNYNSQQFHSMLYNIQ